MSRMADFYTEVNESVERVADNLKVSSDPGRGFEPEDLVRSVRASIAKLKEALWNLDPKNEIGFECFECGFDKEYELDEGTAIIHSNGGVGFLCEKHE